MLEYLLMLIAEWLIIIGLNVVPAFAPPTWMVLSALYIAYPQNIFLLVIVGVTASTIGRYLLARGSKFAVQKLAKAEKKEHLEELKGKLDAKPLSKFLFSFVFCLGPLPSNTLFIVAGATGIRLREILAGFFVGRTISYMFLVFTTQKVFASLAATAEGTANMLTIMIEVIGVLSILFFFFFDWEKFIWGKKDETKKRTGKWKHKK